jgi:hypothetical protein
MVSGIIYECFYILVNGVYPTWSILFKQSMNHKERSDIILQNVNRLHGRMLNIILAFSKPNFKLFQIPIDNGIERR